jgi:arylsulfatase A-like enzyme
VAVLRKILDSPWLYFGLAALIAVVAVASQFQLRLPSRPVEPLAELDRLRERDDVNVVFFLIDTLRADRLSCYGHERETTPVIDFLATSGVRFAHVQSQSSWTKVSMASLWTGAYPRRTGIQRFQDALAPEATLPAEIFKAAGFRTGGIFRNGWLAANFGFNQGYDLYVQPRPSATPAKFERRNPSAHALQGTDWDATESAVEFIRSHKHERFFLYVHYMDVHQYLADIESAKFGNGIRDAYDNALHWTDRNVSAVLGEVEQSDLLDRTLVVIASDHGEAFYEHGLEGHARNLYREVTETPFILILPFRLEPGIVVETPVQNVDVWPTVLDLLGLPPLPDADGRSLVPLIHAAGTGAAPPEDLARRPSFAELDQTWGQVKLPPKPIVAIVTGRHRMIHHQNNGSVELYDHGVDPLEQTNLADSQQEVVEGLQREVARYEEKKASWEAPQIELDEMRKAQLQALGYLDPN